MGLTPLDIHNKEFPVKMRGYDQDEVNNYLDQIIRDYEIVLKDKRDFESKLKFAEEKVEHFNTLQESLNKSIIVAQEAADRLKENAAKEAEIIQLEAENNADHLLDEAVATARKIMAETEELKKQSRIFRQRLQLIIESQLEMVKDDEWEKTLSFNLEDSLDLSNVQETIEHFEKKEQENSDFTEKEETGLNSEKKVDLATNSTLNDPPDARHGLAGVGRDGRRLAHAAGQGVGPD